MTFEHRFLFWSVVVVAMILLTVTVSNGMQRVFGMVRGQRALVLVAGAVAVMLTVLIRAFAAPETAGALGIVTSRPLETLAFLFLTALALAAYRDVALLPDRPAASPIALADDPTADLPRVVARLDAPLHGALLSLTGRDHYVDVRTSAGTGAILMRFSDAMDEVGPVEGAQIHRSHWVAWSAIDAVEKDGGKVFVRSGGLRLPVSRSYRGALVARGLL